ncbi:MAG: NAD-binding protein, partial [Fimbriiglobus sp.]
RMFNQGLIPRLGEAVRNMTALSVSALTAPLIALTAVTGDALGAFHLDAGPQEIAELVVRPNGEFVGQRLSDLASRHQLLLIAHLPAADDPRFLHAIDGDTRAVAGDRLVVCGSPEKLEPMQAYDRGELLPGVRWASGVRRIARAVRGTFAAVDLPVKLAFGVLAAVLFGSTATFHFGLGTDWATGLFQSVKIVATGDTLPGDGQPPWAKVFVSVLKLAGTAMVAGFTAILTNYLIRARLGGAFELAKVPDGGHIVVCGLGNIGFRAVEELVRMRRPVVAIEKVNDNPFAATVRRMGVPVIIGDAVVAETLRQAKADTARAVVAGTESELANLEIALLCKQLNPTGRVVLRLTDPDFAQAVRDAADIKLTVAASAVAAPAFAAALFGDKVHTLISVAGKPLAVVELTVQADDPCLHEKPLVAAMVDYRFLPAGINGQEPFAADGIPRAYRLRAGDRVTAVLAVPDLERLLRREPAPKIWAVRVDAHLSVAKDSLVPIVRAARNCTQDEAEQLLREPQFTLASGL